MSKKIYLIIGIIIFILIIGSYFQITSSNSKSTNNTEKGNIENETEIGEIVYNGKFAMPIENFIQVTSLTQRREMSRPYLSTLMDWLALPMIFRLME